MFFKISHSKLEAYLSEPICKFGWDPFITPEENAKAKAGLEETLRRAHEMLPRTRRVFIGRYDGPLHDGHSNYLFWLYSVKTAMAESRWNDACNDLTDVLHCCHIEDGRILNTVVNLLEGYLLCGS